jgi:AcrR family transcriptional regulator
MARMARWEPNARERLVDAAIGLFSERGYDRTTVGEIAARAGLTERTFFRYFADKREVLFGASGALESGVADAIAGAPNDASPLDMVVAALEAVAARFPPRRDYRARSRLIAAHPELRERELAKLALLTAAMRGALQARGVAEPAANLAAEAGLAIFKTAYERWTDGAKELDFAAHIRVALSELKALTTAAGATTAPTGRRPVRRRSRHAR